MTFDAQFIIALAFFVCVGLIIKFSKDGFSKFLLNTKNAICENINNVENIFDDLRLKISSLKDEQLALKEKNKKSIEDAEREKEFIVQNAQKKSEQLMNSAIENQKITNERIKNESKKYFERISWDSAKQNLTQNLVERVEKVTDLHQDIINNFLEDALNNE
jgi:F0F1-type ATP synthase membrane subunit b/b'